MRNNNFPIRVVAKDLGNTRRDIGVIKPMKTKAAETQLLRDR